MKSFPKGTQGEEPFFWAYRAAKKSIGGFGSRLRKGCPERGFSDFLPVLYSILLILSWQTYLTDLIII
jgi:hypothetical protein